MREVGRDTQAVALAHTSVEVCSKECIQTVALVSQAHYTVPEASVDVKDHHTAVGCSSMECLSLRI